MYGARANHATVRTRPGLPEDSSRQFCAMWDRQLYTAKDGRRGGYHFAGITSSLAATEKYTNADNGESIFSTPLFFLFFFFRRGLSQKIEGFSPFSRCFLFVEFLEYTAYTVVCRMHEILGSEVFGARSSGLLAYKYDIVGGLATKIWSWREPPFHSTYNEGGGVAMKFLSFKGCWKSFFFF